jgi:uncharacterized protein (TIGR02594 family)
MSALPAKYKWLNEEPAPRMLLEAITLYGTVEAAGSANNPTITEWARECGIGAYSTDAIPWCGLFVAVCAKRAGWARPANPLWARDWASWGRARSGGAMLGDVLVFPRGSGGHVAIYIGEDSTHYHILGGNQTDKVCIVRKAKTPILAIRHAPWRVKEPPNVRKVFLTASGTPVSGKEV